MKKERNVFCENILIWFDKNERKLPWRKNKNPYSIWLSEIILQQTRVAQGLSYYEKFVSTFPSVELLAKASEQEILKLWQGLGYYSRARNLHFAAKQIVNDYDGKVPSSTKELLKLKGVGTYTAAAIASIAFNEPMAVVDGNVYRVIARYLGIHAAIDSTQGQKEFAQAAQKLLWKKDPGKYNQAIMEFGALQCTPSGPDCNNCVLNATCFAFNNDLVNKLPVKEKSLKIKRRYFNYLIIKYKNKFVFQKRSSKDIWQGLYEFPLIETDRPIATITELKKTSPILEKRLKKLDFVEKIEQKKHLLTHQEIHPIFWVFVWKVTLMDMKMAFPECTLVSVEEAENLPFPKIIENFWKSIV
jgi:A/G-specific adenine glycosylase